MMKQNRGWLRILTASTLAAVLAACSSGGTAPDNDKDDGSQSGDAGDGDHETDDLVVYSSHPTEMLDHFINIYQEETGIQVDLITGGTGDLLNRVQAEADSPQGDVMWGGSASTGSSKPELFDQYASPLLDEIEPSLLDEEGYNSPFGAFTMLLVYNNTLVSEEDAPVQWQDLTDPKWEDNLRFANPESSSSSTAALATWIAIDGWDLVEGLAKNMIIDDSSSAPFNAVGNGEAQVAVAYEEGAYRWLDSGEVEIVYPEDGVVVLPEGLFKIADGPNSKNAEHFIDWLLAVEQQQELVDNFSGRRPANKNVELPPEMPSADELNILDYSSLDAEENMDDWLSQWRDIMIDLH